MTRTIRSLTAAITALLSTAIVSHVTVAPASAAPAGGKHVATLTALPPLAQTGRTPAAPAEGATLTATVGPNQHGREADLEVQTNNGWKTHSTTTVDGSGNAVFTVTGKARTYRVVLPATGSGNELVTNKATTRSWTPAFEDTFSGTAVDPTKWISQKRDYDAEYGERSCWKASPYAVSVHEGTMRLGMQYDPEKANTPCLYSPKEATATSSHLLGSQMATQGLFSFQYGYAAARIRTQKARGMHSAFWTLPTNEGDVWLREGQSEVDVMEFFGEKGNRSRIGSFVHHFAPGTPEPVKYGQKSPLTTKMLDKNETWSNTFHVFSLEWTPTEYIFRIDGREHYREARGLSSNPSKLVLSMQGSDYERKFLNPKDVGQYASVDWVRVWAL